MHKALRHSTAGFTLFELLVVIVMASVLALIAAPSWLAFVNNRRADAGRDQIFQSLRQAQNQATLTRQRQVVSFLPPANANALPSIKTGTVEQSLDGQIQSGQSTSRTFGLNMVGNLGAGCATGAIGCVVFDDRGTVDIGGATPPDEDTTSIAKIVVTSPVGGGSTRCVIVKTILGGLQNGIGQAECQ